MVVPLIRPYSDLIQALFLMGVPCMGVGWPAMTDSMQNHVNKKCHQRAIPMSANFAKSTMPPGDDEGNKNSSCP